jgi:hypothetical protein
MMIIMTMAVNVRAINSNVLLVAAFGMMMSYVGMAHHAYQQIGFAMVKVIVQMAVMKSDVPSALLDIWKSAQLQQVTPPNMMTSLHLTQEQIYS